MPLDHYVTLGRSGLRVSPLCLGTDMFGGDWGYGASPDTAGELLERFLELGGNFIDTANAYMRGHSEKIIGERIGRFPHRRDRVVIATKFFMNMYRGDPNGGGTGRKAMIAACEQSLRRLRTDYIDLYMPHLWDRHTPIEETLRGLDDLVSSGKVRYVGISDTPAWKVAQAQTLALCRGWTPLIALQIEYSLLERTVEGELIPMAQELGLGVTPWAPLKGGLLNGRYTRDNIGNQDWHLEKVLGRGALERALDERAYRIIDELVRVAQRVERSPAQVALAWVTSRPGVSSTLFGVLSREELEEDVAALELRLPPEEVAALEAVSKPTLGFPTDLLRLDALLSHGGATINGISSPPWYGMPPSDAERH